MGLLRLRLRAERRSATRWIGAILLLTVAGSAALVAAQAARRTDTAFTRDLEHGNASDAVISANTTGETPKENDLRRAAGNRILDAVDRSPLVIAHGRFGGATVARVHNGKVDARLNRDSAFGLLPYDSRIGRTISRPHIDAGRLAEPGRADEVAITRETSALTGWHVGTRIDDLRVYDWAALDENGLPHPDRGTPVRVRVVGVVEFPEELLQAGSERQLRVYFTPAFARHYQPSIFYLTEWVRLRHGAADIPALRAAVARANRADPTIDMPIAVTSEQLAKVNRANDPLVNGLWILAGLFGLVGILLAAQSLGRSLAGRADTHAQLRALGATRRQRFSIEFVNLAAIALVAALFAAVLAYLLSPLTPIGDARDAEPHPGFTVNLALTLVAIAAAFLGTMIATLPALWRLVRTDALPGNTGRLDSHLRRSRVAELVARLRLGTPAAIGTQLALQPGRGETATPVRSVLASLILVLATVTATFAFGVNLQRWTTTPQLYGWNWDAAAGTNFGTIPPEFEKAVESFPNVAEVSALNIGDLMTAGRRIPAIGIGPLRGHLNVKVDSGRVPQNTHEIVLGAKTMRVLGKQIGDRINVTINAKHANLLVVGRATFPAFGNARGGESGLGVGALGTVARFPVVDPSTPGGRFNYMVLRFRAGTTAQTEKHLRAFLAQNGCVDSSCLITDSRPAEINGYRNARGLPLTIGIVLVALLVATLIHVLVSTMRRRSRDFAVLRALGCTPRNLVATMCWQTIVLTGASIVVGVPLGLVVNNLAWRAFSHQLGFAPGTVAPLTSLAIAAAGLLAIAAVLAAAVGSRVPTLTRRHHLTG